MSAQPQPPHEPVREVREVREPVREREVIVTNTDSGRRSSSSGLIVGIVAIVVVLILGYFAIQAIGGAFESGGEAIPDDVNVDVNLPEGGGEAPAGG